MLAPLEIFCCYAREDQELLQQLRKHLMPLQKQNLIKIWSDTDLSAGDEWENVLHKHLESADIILLLISTDFIDSDYCYSTEMKRAIERHDKDSAVVIPVLLRFTFWQDAPFAKLQMVPTDLRPVKSWPDSDQAFHDITTHIHRVVSQLRLKRALTIADAYAQEGKYQEALAVYELVLRLDEKNGPALFGKATMLYQLGKIDASITAFAQAVQIAPNAETITSALLYARALAQQERFTESLTVYDRALSLDPTNAALYAEKATLLIKQKAYDQALNHLEQARRLKPEQVEYVTQAGDLLFRLRHFGPALDMYKQASTLQPGEASHHAWQGQILFHMRRYEEALAAYQQALAITPQAYYYEQAGNICLQLTRSQEALDMYEQAIQTTDGYNPALDMGKGRALFQLARYDEALSCYQNVIQQSTAEVDSQYYEELGKVYERLAEQAYDKSKQQRAIWKPESAGNMLLALLDPAQIELIRTLSGHTNTVTSVAFSPDGSLLASGSHDNTIKLWQLPSGRELTLFPVIQTVL